MVLTLVSVLHSEYIEIVTCASRVERSNRQGAIVEQMSASVRLIRRMATRRRKLVGQELIGSPVNRVVQCT